MQHFTKNTDDIMKSVQKLPIFGDFSLKPAIDFAKKYLTTTFGAQRSQKVCIFTINIFCKIILEKLIFRF